MFRSSGVCALGLTLVLCLGCGGGDKTPRGTVSGKVTFNGMPVTEGVVTFTRKGGGGSGAGTIGSDGSYSASGVEGGIPAGDYTVVVMPPEVAKDLGPNTSPTMVLKEMKDIPAKYRSEATSDLKTSIQQGSNEYNVDMKP
ncbi:hypothetical protein [Planctomyces sp. SH-PL14]|uniref:hypothetical protein n=1 Tax=Planctomyces sp. SH-PL14 TaxID=1632864 RepID=UPI00078D0DAA|nr:hypothetical protein [Planctomyces sp. SH-PL14]AMV20244.1 hypothetical protein VT03_20270 [Planctomyces sp. SH-PL14]